MQNNKMTIENIPQYDFSIIEIIKAGFARIDGVKAAFFIRGFNRIGSNSPIFRSHH